MPRASKRAAKAAPGFQAISPAQVEFAYDEGAPMIYTDGVRMLASAYGITLILTQLELGPTQQARARHVGTLSMSREHAKVVVRVLAEQIAHHESTLEGQ